MPFHPPKNLISIAERLADELNSEHGLQTLRLMARLNSKQTPAAGGSAPASLAPYLPQVTPGRIGIWQQTPKSGDGSYVRVETNQRSLWADQDRIYPKKGRRRVVLLGESVARGFLYDPWFNPARALQRILGAVKETSDIEVVDLARISCGIRMLIHLAASCLQLEPDALVVFAGNNWNPYGDLGRAEFQEIARRLRTGQRWAEVKDYVEEKLRLATGSFLESIATIANARSIPVILIIPEFNLRDWRTGCNEAIHFLPWATAARWTDTYEEAKAALCDQHLEKVAELAAEMMSLDGGTTSVSQEMLAHCKAAAGETAEARRLFEGARDTVLRVPGDDTPRCFSVVQEVFRARAAKMGMSLVDLPQRFEEYAPGTVPDRRLFLDYCHLTAEGMRIAMASAAERLLPVFNAPHLPWRGLANVDMDVPGEISAAAHFMAAIHNSHWRQGYDIILYHCRQAIESDPEFANTMTRFLDHYIRRAPSLLCRSFHDMAWQDGKPRWETYLMMAHEPQQAKIVNPLLVEATLEVLKPAAPEIRQDTLKLLVEQHGMEHRDVDLLNPIYWGITYRQRAEIWSEKFGYYAAFTPETKFHVPCRRGEAFTLTLTYRARPTDARAGDSVFVSVNNQQIASLEAASSWRTEVIGVPSECVEDGLNVIRINWPQVRYCVEDEIQRIAWDLELGSLPDLFPIYGGVHTALASARKIFAD